MVNLFVTNAQLFVAMATLFVAMGEWFVAMATLFVAMATLFVAMGEWFVAIARKTSFLNYQFCGELLFEQKNVQRNSQKDYTYLCSYLFQMFHWSIYMCR